MPSPTNQPQVNAPLFRCKPNHRWSALAVVSALLISSASAPADESLARHVPADVGLFAELRGGADLIAPLTDPQAWLTLAELSGQPARIEETAHWRLRVRQTIGMDPIEAISRLFSQRVAFVGEGVRRSQDAAVLCRPAERPRELMSSWHTQPLPTASRTAVYRLPNHVGLAIEDDLMVFGDYGTTGMFSRVVQTLETGKRGCLADDPVFRGLLRRVPPNPDGVFFARLAPPPPTTTSAPTTMATASPATADLPGPLRGSRNILLALHRDGKLLRFSAVGDATTAPRQQAPAPRALLEALPERTLVAWAGHLDYGALASLAMGLPERHLLRVAYKVQSGAGTLDRLLAALDADTCIAVGAVLPTRDNPAAPALPALGLLVKTKDPAVVKHEWSTLLHSTLAVYKLLMLRAVAPPTQPPTLDSYSVGETVVDRLDLSPLLAATPADTLIGELHLCWAIDGDVLIMASHSDWLEQILAARNNQAARLEAALTAGEQTAGASTSLFIAQTGPIADLGTLWLRFLEQAFPQTLDEDWWRKYQPGGDNIQIGIQVVPNRDQRRLIVRSVTPGSPADGVLRPGDEIIGINRRRFASADPIQEALRGLKQRPDARWVDIYVVRDGGLPRLRRLPLPFVDPIQLLRRLNSIGRIVQRVAYVGAMPSAEGPRGQLTVELRSTATPLYAFPKRVQSTDPK